MCVFVVGYDKCEIAVGKAAFSVAEAFNWLDLFDDFLIIIYSCFI